MTVDAQSARKPGRPKDAAKRDAIMQAAAQVFMEHGAAASMDAVAAAAGVSKQTVYSHFGSKEDLFEAMIQLKVQDFLMVPEAFDLDGEPEGILRLLCQRCVDLLYDDEVVSMNRLMIAESRCYPEIARLFFEKGPRRTSGVVAGILERLTECGALEIDDSTEAALLLLTLVRGSEHMQRLMNLIAESPEAWRRAHADKVFQRFVTLYGAAHFSKSV